MSYIVLARRLRPQHFDQVIGQKLVVQALTNALSNGKTHPAYLLTGTHGTGKTTLGRLIAKALNCETGPLPCLKCQSCEMIQNGTHPDLYEIDAASRTKVEDTKDVLEHVQYLPVMGKKKIYLIDEVHMLSQHSFNALLKTLEEPPSHVQFILATTEPHKIPKTILSRCLHFNLQPLMTTEIQDYLATTLETEKISYDQDALSHIAKASKGSMRDALSLLDQCIAISPEHINIETTSSLLSSLPDQALDELLILIAKKDITTIQSTLERYRDNNIDLKALLLQLSEKLVNLSIDMLKNKQTPLTDLWPDTYVQVLYRMLMQAISDLPYGPSPYLGALMCLIRMSVFYPSSESTPPKTTDRAEPSLSSLMSDLKLSPMMKELLSHCDVNTTKDKWVLTLATSHKHLLTPQTPQKIEAALKEALQRNISVSIELGKSINTPYQQQQTKKKAQTEKAEKELSKDPVLSSLLKELEVPKDKVIIEPATTE